MRKNKLALSVFVGLSLGICQLAQAISPSEIPLCKEQLNQTAADQTKKDKMAAAIYVTAKYADISGALDKLEINEDGGKNSICGEAVIIGVNDHFPGDSKYVYLFRFNVSQGDELKAVVPVLMYDTSVQGHENGKNAFPLKNRVVSETLNALVKNHPLDQELTIDKNPLDPEFVSSLQQLPIGKQIILPENAYAMSLGRDGSEELFLLTGFKKISGMNESRVVTFGILLSYDEGSGVLKYNNSISVMGDLQAPLAGWVIHTPQPGTLNEAVDQIVKDAGDLL